MTTIQQAASLMGKKGGRASGGLKAEASRMNGALGGRPRVFPPCPSGQPHRWNKKKLCRFCGLKKPKKPLIKT